MCPDNHSCDKSKMLLNQSQVKGQGGKSKYIAECINSRKNFDIFDLHFHFRDRWIFGDYLVFIQNCPWRLAGQICQEVEKNVDGWLRFY